MTELVTVGTDAATQFCADTPAGYDRLLERLHVVEQVTAWSNNRLESLVQARKGYVVDVVIELSAGRVVGLEFPRCLPPALW